MKTFSLFAGVGLALAGHASSLVAAPVPPAGWHALVDVNVVDVRDGIVIPHQTIVWHRSRILAVGPAGVVAPPREALVIEAGGLYVVPGLCDMHVHVRPDFGGAEIALPQFIANGVTSVREMGETPDAEHPFDTWFAAKRTWHDQAIAGQRVGPRILGIGSLHVDGPSLARGQNPKFFGAATPEEARQLVRYIRDETGADFIKVYSRIPRDSFFALMDEARRLGIVVCGHKPLAVSFVEAADAGFHSMEHAREMLLDSFPGAAELQRHPEERNLPPARLREIMAAHDPAMLQEIFSAMTRNGAYYCPTHTTRKFDAFAGDAAYTADPRLRFVPAQAQRAWQRDIAQTLARAPTPEDRETYRQFYRAGLAVTGAAAAVGVKILAGTDAGDSFCFYGSALHDELENLVAAGLSPAQALRAATVTPAEYFGRERDAGEISAGKLADLVVLEANPLENIAHVRRIHGVAFNGRYYDRGALDRILAEVETQARSVPASPKS